MTYKPEVDGLRAIGVLLVLFCHIRLGLPGGFIGVDVFFVISGFLITSIVFNGVSQNKFSFLNFYGRRFFRLYPALIIVVLATLIAALLICDPKYLQNLARTGRYALMSLSNIYYMNHQGYFDFGANSQPFLHTWSLGVEWQFYLIWPALIWAIWRVFKSPKAIIAVLFIITIASLVLGQMMIAKNAQAAYYHMFYRACELGIGGLLVFFYNRQLNPQASAAVMFGGCALIAYGSFAFSAYTAFPGYASLVPCLGAAACIYGGQGFAKGNFLRWAPMVYVGKISYSVYLVHWPMILLYQYYVYRDLSLTEKIVICIVTLALGALIYTFIEKKISWAHLANKLRASIITFAVIAACIAAMVYVKSNGHGLEWRTQNQELGEDQYMDWGGGHYPIDFPLGDADGKKLAILTGDSLAASLTTGFDQALKGSGNNIYQMVLPGCFLSEIDETPNLPPQCKARPAQVIQAVNAENLPLIIQQAWGVPVMLPERDIVFLISQYKTRESYFKFLTDNLDDIHTKIKQRPLILIGSYPYRRWGDNEKECLRRPAFAQQACLEEIAPFKYEDIPVYEYNQFLKNYAQTHDNVYYIDPVQAACPNGLCETLDNAKIYNDGFHLSVYGSKQIAPYIVEQVEKIIQSPQAQASLERAANLK